MDLLAGVGELALLEGGELGGRVQGVDGRVVEGQVHVLDATHVRGAVLGEAAGDVGARGVGAGEEAVGAAGPVGAPVA